MLTFPCGFELSLEGCVCDGHLGSPHRVTTHSGLSMWCCSNPDFPPFFSQWEAVPVLGEVKEELIPSLGLELVLKSFLCRISTSPPPLPFLSVTAPCVCTLEQIQSGFPTSTELTEAVSQTFSFPPYPYPT